MNVEEPKGGSSMFRGKLDHVGMCFPDALEDMLGVGIEENKLCELEETWDLFLFLEDDTFPGCMEPPEFCAVRKAALVVEIVFLFRLGPLSDDLEDSFLFKFWPDWLPIAEDDEVVRSPAWIDLNSNKVSNTCSSKIYLHHTTQFVNLKLVESTS